MTLEEIGSRAKAVSRTLNNLGSREKNIGLEEAAAIFNCSFAASSSFLSSVISRNWNVSYKPSLLRVISSLYQLFILSR